MANVKVSALSSLTSAAEADTLVINDYSEAGEKVKSITIPNLRVAMLLPGVDNTNDIGSSTKRIKDLYVKGNVYVNDILQGKQVTVAIHRKIIDIGDWDMDATAQVAVDHGMSSSLGKIRSVVGIVRSDDSSTYHPIALHYSATTPADCYISHIYTDFVYINRKTGGYFDSIDFNATSFNRGQLVIDYVD